MNKSLIYDIFIPAFLLISIITTMNFLFVKNIRFINEESFVIEKIKKYINNLDRYEDCMKYNPKEECIILHREMIDSRDDMDDALIRFFDKTR